MTHLFAVIAAGCVAAGIFREAPGIGVAVSICFALVLIRTSSIAALHREMGRPMTASAAIGAFAISLAIVAVIAAAAISAFVLVCFPTQFLTFRTCADNTGVLIAMGLGVAAATAAATTVFILLLRRVWPRRPAPPPHVDSLR